MRPLVLSQTPPLAAAVVLSALVLAAPLAGCSRFGPRGNEEECKKACAKVAQHETNQLRNGQFVTVHEADEHLEQAEDAYRDNMKALDQEEAAGALQPDTAMLAKLSPARRQSVLVAHKLREEEIAAQRKLARERVKASLKAVEEQTADIKSKSKARVEAATTESLARCSPLCLAGSLAQAQCLQRTQAIEDVAHCKP